MQKKIISTQHEEIPSSQIPEYLRIQKFINNVIKEILQIQEFAKNNLKNPVTIFSSARTESPSPEYDQSYNLAYAFAKEGFQIMTGGGPGSMEASNKGALDANKKNSFGIGIEVPFENKLNNYLTNSMMCKYFFTRKLGLMINSVALIVNPGGFGTLEELFEIVALKDRHPSLTIPIILTNKEYYQELITLLNSAHTEGYLKKEPSSLVSLISDNNEIIKYVQNHQQSLAEARNIDTDKLYEILSSQLLELSDYHQPYITSIISSTTRIDPKTEHYENADSLSFQLSSLGISLMFRSSDPFSRAITKGWQTANVDAEDKDKTEKPVCLECVEDDYNKTTSKNNNVKLIKSMLLFEQKVIATRNTNLGYIFFPGGSEVLDLFFELLCLKQTFKLKLPIPINTFYQLEKKYNIPYGTINDTLIENEYINSFGQLTQKFKPRSPSLHLHDSNIPATLTDTIIQSLLKSQNIPLILMDSSYWNKWDKYFKNTIINSGAANSADLNLYRITDHVDVAISELLLYQKTLINW